MEGVVDVVFVSQDGASACGEDHGTVACHQCLESRLVAGAGVTGQEASVVQTDGGPVTEQVTEVPQGLHHSAACHGRHPHRGPRPSWASFFDSRPSQYRIRETCRPEPPDFLVKTGDLRRPVVMVLGRRGDFSRTSLSA